MAGSAFARARLAAGGPEGSRVSELQRARLLSGAVAAFDERGYAHTTVADITSRARVSRRTFYELFVDREACLAAVLEESVGLLGGELAAAGLEGLAWRERVRMGLWRILVFFDCEPALARVCVVQALRAGAVVQERREALLAQLAAVVDGGRLVGARGEVCTPLVAEGLVGAAFAIVHRRLSRGECEPLAGLVGELVGMVVLPYLGSAAARRERERPVPVVPAAVSRVRLGAPRVAPGDPLAGVQMRLTYRTARVLEAVGLLGDLGTPPSNRMVADRAGIHDPGQISKLLRRLERLGLLANTGAGAHMRGEPNAWALTAQGERFAQSIRMSLRHERRAA
jgi:AcrR family transcriptional regulator